MKIIGITGKSGSGKSMFASLLAQKLQCRHVDIDKVGHQANFQPEIITGLCENFGHGILDECGNVDRKKLGAIVFADEDKMKILSDLTWGYMEKQLDSMLSDKSDCIVFEWILLPQSKYWDMCDSKILVTSDNAQRRRKVLERDHISEEYFDKRDSKSIDYSPYKFDYVFENDYNPETMQDMISKVVTVQT